MSKNKAKEPAAKYGQTVEIKKPILDFSQLDLSKQYTYADYLRWQFKERVELIKGWIHKMAPAPKRLHQRLSAEILYLLIDFIKKENKQCEVFSAPFDVRLIKNKGKETKEIDTVVQPDISIICDKKKLDDRGCLGAPDMIIEIISKGTAKKDQTIKFDLYEENGVKEYWLVYPEGAIDVYYLKNGKYQPQGLYEPDAFEVIQVGLFPKLIMSLKEIFKD